MGLREGSREADMEQSAFENDKKGKSDVKGVFDLQFVSVMQKCMPSLQTVAVDWGI